MPQRGTYVVRVSWEVALLRFRDGVGVEFDPDLVVQIFERHGVVDVDAPEYLYRDPADPESLWTTIYRHTQAVMFYRPTVGSVWNLIFDLMQEFAAVLQGLLHDRVTVSVTQPEWLAWS
ncbi:hypothetical protein TPB0596_32500 [Tsukamurella pulmonis]|nr:hypothetical protein TPB0596_32500 [Tsukamurella pulmonis]